MTYNEIINYIDNEETGIAKGYSYQFLSDAFCLNTVKKIIQNDLNIFSEIEKSLLEIKEPLSGDFVIYGDNKIARLYKTFAGNYQISNGIGVYVSNGFSQGSGCVYDFDIEEQYRHCKSDDLVLTDAFKKGRCWTFSGNESGGGRGVYFEINFKVWKLEKCICPICRAGKLVEDGESIDSGICSKCGEQSYFQDAI